MFFITFFALTWILIGLYYICSTLMAGPRFKPINLDVPDEKLESNLREALARDRECRGRCGENALVVNYGNLICDQCPYRKEI